MKKSPAILLLLIVFGTIYFPNAFQWVWLGLGIVFCVFLIAFHAHEKHQNKKFTKKEGS